MLTTPSDLRLRASDRANSVPRVLVLLATFNGESWIDEQINSILAQSAVDVDLLIRDDGSGDSTRDLIGQHAHSNQRVLIMENKEGPSGSAAQNFFTLMRKCCAEGYDFIALADQDDIWNPEKLHRATSTLIDSGADGYSSAVTAIWPSGRRTVLRQNPSQTASDHLLEGAGQGCTFVFTSNFYRRLQSFLIEQESLTGHVHFHDWTVYAITRSWKRAWVFDQQPSLLYRQHNNNDTGARTSIKGIAERLDKIRRGWYRDQLLGISAICQAAAPNDPVIDLWRLILMSPQNLQRRLKMTGFCMRGGRRRRSDNAILAACSLLGWI